MNLLVVFIAAPLFTAFILPIADKFFKKGFDQITGLVTFLLFICAAYLAIFTPELPVIYSVGSWKAPFGISWILDSLTIFMLLIVNAMTFFISVYSANYMERYTSKWKYYTLLMLMLAGLNGVVLTGDIFNLYVFLEITAISSYALVAFGTEA